MHNHGKAHWNVVKWILQYLKGTSHLRLISDKNKSTSLDVMDFVGSNYEYIFTYVVVLYLESLLFNQLLCYQPLRWGIS